TRIPALGRDFCWVDGRLAYPDPCVAEHAHPGAVFAPVVRVPGVLDGAEDAFRVRHQDGDAAVAGGQAGDAAGGAVGVGGVAVGHAAVVVDEAQGYAAAGFAGVHGGAVGKLGTAFAVADGGRHARGEHAAGGDRRRWLGLDHGGRGFELLGAAAYEARPVCAAGEKRAQVGQRLTAVAHAEGGGVGAGKVVAEAPAGLI